MSGALVQLAAAPGVEQLAPPSASQLVEIPIPLQGQTYDQAVTVFVPRSGDVLEAVFLEATVRRVSEATHWPAHALLRECELVIGGQTVSSHTGEFMLVRDRLFMSEPEIQAQRRLVDFADAEPVPGWKTLWLRLPLPELPLLALTKHAVALRLRFAARVAGLDPAEQPRLRLWASMGFADEPARRALVQPRDILVEQIQRREFNVAMGGASSVLLDFKHPVRYLAWTTSPPEAVGVWATGVPGSTAQAGNPTLTARLTFDGHDRVPEMPAVYYNCQEPWAAARTSPPAGVHLVHFARPAAPTMGTANFSRMASVVLHQTYKAANATPATSHGDFNHPALAPDELPPAGAAFTRLRVYASSWNRLRVADGTAGVVFA